MDTLDRLDESFSEKGRRIAETDFEGVEFAGFDDTTAAQIAAILEEMELEPIALHVDLETLEEAPESVVEACRTIACSHVVVPRYDREAFATEAGIQRAAARISTVARDLADDGVRLSYHNHRFEFQEVDGKTAFSRFVDALDPSVGLEIDTGLAHHAGQDPAALIREYADRTRLVHLTDARSTSDNTFHVELQAGEVDLQACVRACHDADVEWLIYEHGNTTDPVASLEHGGLLLPRIVVR